MVIYRQFVGTTFGSTKWLMVESNIQTLINEPYIMIDPNEKLSNIFKNY